jgi:two-component system phosphate regulon sensor histidine kinase PhoR
VERQPPAELVISVADSGIGIPPDELGRIFERFYKTDRSRSSGGTGLGLAIAKHVVQAHGGHIWADSSGSQGTTFSFTLPTARPEPPGTVPARSATTEALAGG